jgi:hypothetical protein
MEKEQSGDNSVNLEGIDEVTADDLELEDEE